MATTDSISAHGDSGPPEPHLAPQTSAPASSDSKPQQASNPSFSVPQRHVVQTRVEEGVRVVPPQFEHCEVEDLIALIASMLSRLMEHNDRVPLTPAALTRFHSRAPPGISVQDYLIRIARFTNVEPCCLLMILYYVDRVCAALPSFTISSLTVHRFVIAAVASGSKALSDSFCTNGRYARVGGVTLIEMNLLEKEFLLAIDWRLTTSGTVLEQYYTSLVRSHPGYRTTEAEKSSSIMTT